MNWEGYERKRLFSVLRHYSDIRLVSLRKTNKELGIVRVPVEI
jgi:hypothetical protein